MQHWGTQQQDVRRVEGDSFDRGGEGSELIMEEAITTIGETGALTGEPRLVSVKALTDCNVMDNERSLAGGVAQVRLCVGEQGLQKRDDESAPKAGDG
ncbi:MAG: hypothetical protein CME19_06920 [Gemmatimonadetes bacterium]|nr:hypothetical protein [Gemmatimonadota bacterium]